MVKGFASSGNELVYTPRLLGRNNIYGKQPGSAISASIKQTVYFGRLTTPLPAMSAPESWLNGENLHNSPDGKRLFKSPLLKKTSQCDIIYIALALFSYSEKGADYGKTEKTKTVRCCMHPLGHTCASRGIGSGVMPKALRNWPAYPSIKTTMDHCVRATEDSLTNADQQFEQNTSLASLKMVCCCQFGAQLVRRACP